jgi:hypothetical protein
VNSRIGEKHVNLQDARDLYDDGEKAELNAHGWGTSKGGDCIILIANLVSEIMYLLF